MYTVAVTSETSLANRIPDTTKAIKILKNMMAYEENSCEITALNSSGPNNVDISPPAKKKKPTLFSLAQKAQKATGQTKKTYENELEEYLNIELLGENDSPLDFWERNETRFPILAKLSQIYLAIPATSGSVERLFSVAACFARAKRARLTIENLERLLCVQQQMLNEMKE